MISTPNVLDARFLWLNEPTYSVQGQALRMKTSPMTDFWQRTHYGVCHDNAHCLVTAVDHDFLMSVRTTFRPQSRFDQCGLIVRRDADNWIKTSTEYESESHSRLGSVVTNYGYSDWATTDVSSSEPVAWYRIQSRNGDFLIEYSHGGANWKQMRVCHLHAYDGELQVGIYACSPLDGSFDAHFDDFVLRGSEWEPEPLP